MAAFLGCLNISCVGRLHEVSSAVFGVPESRQRCRLCAIALPADPEKPNEWAIACAIFRGSQSGAVSILAATAAVWECDSRWKFCSNAEDNAFLLLVFHRFIGTCQKRGDRYVVEAGLQANKIALHRVLPRLSRKKLTQLLKGTVSVWPSEVHYKTLGWCRCGSVRLSSSSYYLCSRRQGGNDCKRTHGSDLSP